MADLGPDAIVCGGGIAGLGTALALARNGMRVRVIESDATQLPDTPAEAFDSWQRRGAPQVQHSHAFLARLRELLRARAPEVLTELMRAGAAEIRFMEMLPATIDDPTPRPGDDQLVALACRRITFEWVLRRRVLAEPNVEFQQGAVVKGLVSEPSSGSGPPRVRGVHLETQGHDEVHTADIVIDATGRRSRAPRWLAEIGAAPVPEEREDCGIFYCSRFYRLLPGVEPPRQEGPIGADLGYMKYAVFQGDAGVFSVTLAAAPEDAPMRALLRPGPFEAAARVLPATRAWVDPTRAEPISRVTGMAALRNVKRDFVVDGSPLALGFHVVGDGAIHTNPLYGRGCTLAMVHAYLLADAIADTRGDPVAAALAFHGATARGIVPWYRASLDQDRESRVVAESERSGESVSHPAAPNAPVDPKKFMREVMREGLFPALRTDATVLRAFLRSFNLLDTPATFLRDGQVLARIVAAYQDRARRKPAEPEGPPRSRMLELLAEAA